MESAPDEFGQWVRESEQVHVLRHTFRPNEPFQASLAELVNNGPHETRYFTIYGSDERIFDMDEFVSHDFEAQQRNANKYLETKSHIIHLEGPVKARELVYQKEGEIVSKVALQLVMKPFNMPEYAQLRLALDAFNIGRRGYPLGFQASRLYLNIPYTQLRPTEEVKQQLWAINKTFKTDSTSHLYQLMPDKQLAGEFLPYTSRPGPKNVTYPNYPEQRAS